MPSVTTGCPSDKVATLDEAISALSWDSDGSFVWTGTATGKVDRLDPAGCIVRPAEDRPHHRRRIVALAVDPASGTVVSADDQGLVVLCGRDGRSGHVDAGSRPRTLGWSLDGSLLAITSQAAGLIVVDDQARRVCALPASRRHRCAAWHQPTGSRQLAVAGAGALTWLDTSSEEPVTHTTERAGATLAVASTPGGWLALGDLRGIVTIANTDLQIDLRISGWPDPVRHLTWVGGARHLVVCGGDQLTAWEPPSAASDRTGSDGAHDPDGGAPSIEPLQTSPDGFPVCCIAAHPWRPAVAVGTEGGTVAVWTPSSDERVDLPPHDAPISSIAWDPVGELLAIGLRSGAVHIWAP